MLEFVEPIGLGDDQSVKKSYVLSFTWNLAIDAVRISAFIRNNVFYSD